MRKSVQMKIIQGALILFLCFSAHAFILYDESSNVFCEYSINHSGHSQSLNNSDDMKVFCEDKRMTEKADKYIDSHKLGFNQVHHDYEIAVDMSSACMSGIDREYWEGIKHIYTLFLKYNGDEITSGKIAKAYRYGKLIARSAHDCTNYVMGK